jgi:hypothetical protein
MNKRSLLFLSRFLFYFCVALFVLPFAQAFAAACCQSSSLISNIILGQSAPGAEGELSRRVDSAR